MFTALAACLLLHKTGQIRVGMLADLVVLTKNPLDDIRNTRNIETVYKGGGAYR